MIPPSPKMLPRFFSPRTQTGCPPTTGGTVTVSGSDLTSHAALARKHGLTRSQLEVGLAYCRCCVGNLMAGVFTPEQLHKRLAASPVSLSPEFLADVGRLYRQQANAAL